VSPSAFEECPSLKSVNAPRTLAAVFRRGQIFDPKVICLQPDAIDDRRPPSSQSTTPKPSNRRRS
jgi:hypothetical protein